MAGSRLVFSEKREEGTEGGADVWLVQTKYTFPGSEEAHSLVSKKYVKSSGSSFRQSLCRPVACGKAVWGQSSRVILTPRLPPQQKTLASEGLLLSAYFSPHLCP